MAYETVNRIKALQPILISSDFERKSFSQAENAETENVFGGDISVSKKPEGGVYIATCDFLAGEKLKLADDEEEKFLFEVRATYVIGIEVDGVEVSEDDLKLLFIDAAASSIWPVFRSYFGLVGAQANSDLPQLPLAPGTSITCSISTN